MSNLQQLQQMAAEVVGLAEADPEAAPEVYTDAASQFRAFAQRQRDKRLAGELARIANAFEDRAHLHVVAGARATADDFDELEVEHAEAHHDHPLDDTEMLAEQRSLHEEHRSERVSILPASITQDTALGRSTMVKFNPTEEEKANGVKETDTILMWSGSKFEPQACTIDLDLAAVPPADPTSTLSYRPYAIVTYAIDGFKSSFRMDVGQGQRITLPANYVDVSVGMGPPPGVAGITSGVMSIGAKLGFFASPTSSPVMLTEYADGVSTAFPTATVLRPQKAMYLLPVQSTDPMGTSQLDFYDYGNILCYSLIFANGTLTAPIPLTNPVARIVLTKLSGASPVSYQFPFQLST